MNNRFVLTVFFFLCTLFIHAQITMDIDASSRGPLTSPYQYGLFFEEINHAGEGGLYAELVKNRAFDEGTSAWSAVNGASISAVSKNLLNASRRQALSVNVSGASSSNLKGVSNTGFWGMSFRKDSTYTLNVWVKGSKSLSGHLTARLMNGTTVVGSSVLKGALSSTEWQKQTVTIKATADCAAGTLQIVSDQSGAFTLGFVSFFPYTWKGRANGLRPDLAQLLYNTKPTFLRFPGGCYVEGETSYDNAFQWKKTIGPVEQRPGHLNKNWGYWSTDGLGFDEYLQLCEDFGAAPLFVVNVGLGHGYYIPMEDVDTLIQSTLDAIEYANGDENTYWGAKRIANGHPAPYNLKFIEIGNENYNFNMASNSDQSYQYPERYYKFYKAIKAKYPEITTIGNVEAWGTDNPSWRNDYPVELVDEHYYRTSSWMLDNYTKYDNYNREVKVYNGEYAANSGSWGKYGNVNSALGEAVYMMGMEKNSDVVKMGSFAPIFTHEKDPRWAYDMIHFNAAKNFVTPSYYVQKLFGHNLGTQNLKWTETGNATTSNGGKVGVATWNTQAEYDDVSVTDTLGKTLASDDFSNGTSNWTLGNGTWAVSDGALAQTANGTDYRAVMNTSFNGDYIYKVRARKTGGNEGFLIMFNVKDDNNYYWWNLGGWNNTQHGVEHAVNGSKTTVATASGSIETGKWYDIEIRVSGSQVTCLLDGQQIHQFTVPAERKVYQSVQLDSTTNELIVKLVNPKAEAATVKVNAKNMTFGDGAGTVEATLHRLASANGTDENTMDDPDKVAPTDSKVSLPVADNAVSLDVPAYSLSIFRIPVSNVGEEQKVAYPTAYTEEDQDKTGYLYAHMNNNGEYTNYALSRHGQEWNDLLGGQEVFDTKAATTTGGMRDAYVCRLHDNSGFMLVGTDMTSRLGWTSNHIMDLMLTPDLVHWTKEVKIDLESKENLKALGGITADEMTAAWAPQVIYDPVTEKYVLYYSVGFASSYHRIYYQLLDKDLNILSKPKLYFDPGYDIIDADIVYNAETKQYMMIYKCEQAKGLSRATATTLVPAKGQESGTTVWTVTPGFHVTDGNQNIEAPTQWRPIGSDRWNLSYVNYSYYAYKTRHMDAEGLNPGNAINFSGSVAAQHGSILKLTETEYQYLLNWDSVKTLLPKVKKYYETSKVASIGEAVTLAENALSTSTTVAENVEAMAKALKALNESVVAYKNYIKDKVESGGEADLSFLIQNADFSQGAEGWTKSGNFTQANGYVAEYWNNASFDFHQTVTDLPAGKYELTVQSFYRYGGKEVGYPAHVSGTEKLLPEFYANNASVSIKSLYDDEATSVGQYTYDPYTYPNDVTAANKAFNTLGLYKDTLNVTLDEAGSITLGIRKTEAMSNDWCIWDNFTLKYLGKATAIRAVVTDNTKESPIYNLSGERVVKATAQGIYVMEGRKVVKR